MIFWVFWLSFWSNMADDRHIIVPPSSPPPKPRCRVVDLGKWRADHPPVDPKTPTDRRAA